MARGGVNKVLVSKARETLISRGENPSIDAVRVELGNTGSKSTIHRYLREIEEKASARLDDEALLSKPIKELVGRLASTLKQEAQAVLDENHTKHKNQVQSLTARTKELEDTLASDKKTLEEKEHSLRNALAELASTRSAEETLKVKLAQVSQAEDKLQALVAEKQSQIDSLEEKHRHNREAMEHYRQSIKDQRDQDQRKHEQQSQQLQGEIRTLNQALSVKQTDITQLNKDNGRLTAELGSAHKAAANLESEQRKLLSCLESKTEKADALKSQLVESETKLSRSEIEFAKLESKIIEFEIQKKELAKVKKMNEELQSWKAGASVSIGKLEAELSVKTDMMNRFLKEASKEASK